MVASEPAGLETLLRSPGRSCCRDWRSVSVGRHGTTVGACTSFGVRCAVPLASVPVDLEEQMLAGRSAGVSCLRGPCCGVHVC